MNNKTKIRCYSDLHLDHYNGRFNVITGEPVWWTPPELPDDKETILILAGDIWTGTKWIEFAGHSWISKIASRFKTVLVVLGNHDYWPCNSGGLSITKGGDKCNALLQDMGYHNVKVLDRDTHTVSDILFVGATLWTDMDKGSPLAMMNMRSSMAYDSKCTYETIPWCNFTSERWVKTYCQHRDYIKHVVEQNKDKKIVVITHHLPLLTMNDPRYIGDSDNCYYSSDLSEFILDNPHIKMWACGHTHHCYDEVFGETRMINRSVGYVNEHKEQRGLISHDVFEL